MCPFRSSKYRLAMNPLIGSKAVKVKSAYNNNRLVLIKFSKYVLSTYQVGGIEFGIGNGNGDDSKWLG